MRTRPERSRVAELTRAIRRGTGDALRRAKSCVRPPVERISRRKLMKSNRAFAVIVVAFVSLGVVLPSHSTAQTNGEPERFTAVAINMGSPGRAGANQVEIVVNRWSTEAERSRLLQALFDKGPEKLLDTLVDVPRVGYFRTPTS